MSKTLDLTQHVVTRHNAVMVGDTSRQFVCRVLDINSLAQCELTEQENCLSPDDECISTCKLDDAREEVLEAAQSWIDNSVIVRRIAGETNRQGQHELFYYVCRGQTGCVQIRPDAAPHWCDDGLDIGLDDDDQAAVLNAIDAL